MYFSLHQKLGSREKRHSLQETAYQFQTLTYLPTILNLFASA